MENLNENDVSVRELADMIGHLQPQISEFLHELKQIQTEQERLTQQAKVNNNSNIDCSFPFFQTFEGQYRLEYNSLKQWLEFQQQFERIFTKISKDFDQSSQAHSLYQLEEFTENLTVNTNQQELIENLFRDARRMINSLEQSNQKNLIRSIEQYEVRWKELRERLKQKLSETSKFHWIRREKRR